MPSDKTTIEILKAVRKLRREEELRAFGHPISYTRVVKNKKVYTRKEKHKGSSLA